MSQTVITKAFVEWKARQAADNQFVTLDEFIFAYVPGQDDTVPVANTETIPTDKIVYRQAVGKTGVVNANSVVYSVTLGADVGDFDFNWIGLANKATGTLGMIIHAPTQRKVKNASGQQGNVLVRSMLMEYSGAQASTNITTPAETWQIDFTARLAGMDEAVRLSALDIYGAGAFFDNGFLVAKTGTQFFVTAGLGYVGGLRAALAANRNITVSAKPTKVWVDVCYQGTLTSAYKTEIKFTVAASLANYSTNGVMHYVFALASIGANGAITDLRPKGSSLYLRRDKNLADIDDTSAALNTLNGVPKTRTVNKKALTDDIILTPADVGAISNVMPSVDNTMVTKLYDPSIVGLSGGVTLAGYFDDHPLGATFQAADTLVSHRRWYNAGAALTQYLHCTTGVIYVRVGIVSSTEPGGWLWRQANATPSPFGWRKLFDSANPPTAAEVGAFPVAPGVLGTTDINTLNVAKIGLYVQSTGANATVANGYPAGSQAAGVLEVIPASWTGGVMQRYTVQNTGIVWTRALNATWNGTDGPWRDWVQASTAGSVGANSALGSTDLNTVGFGLTAVQAAIYHQSANASATPERNYPEAKAGTLFVTGSAYGCQQMYITFDTCNVWMRGLSTNWNGKDGPWRPWVAVYGTNNKPTAADVGAWSAAQSAASEKALSDEIATAFKIRANLTAADSPNALHGTAMFGHYGVPGVAAATTDKGYPMNNFVGVIFVTWGPNATQQIAFNNTGRQFTRSATGAWNGTDGPWSAWNEIYCQANKPTPADVGALPAAGTAVAATKLATARKIAGVAFDGTKDIGLNADNVGAFPRVGGDVNGRVTANYLRAISSANPGEGQGTYLGWNESGGQGESNFINNKGGGVGGFSFRIVNQANNAQTGYFRISGTGDLSAQGNIYSDGGAIYEMGQRVYSPNNRQPVNTNTANLGGGWWRCGDTGMIKQWGYVNKGSRGWSTVNFPIPFPNACVNVQVTVINGGAGTFVDNFGTAQIINNIGFTCGQDSNGSYWEATGW
jgi:hypothetical protein